MDRRTFVLLTGAASAALFRPPRPLPGLARRPLGNLRFDLDDQRRLALWYNAPDRSIPLLRNAALGLWVGDTLVTLADLENVSVGNRRPPGGESLVIRGRTPGTAGGASGSEWLPARPVRPDGDSATLRIAYLPEGDGLTALTAAATPLSSVDRERIAALAVPTGWCSWYELGPDVTEADVVANVDFCAAHFDRRSLRYIQLDDGYQRAA